jgi:SAM-dependent methyltransferase
MVSAPHPLAERLIERLQARPESRVLDFATGSGRNAAALRRSGFTVVIVDDAAAASEVPLEGVPDPLDAVLSTHGLLHGTPASIEHRLRAIAAHLTPHGLLYATFGSTLDARFGRGERIDDATFAPLQGDERGVAHAYFDRERLAATLERDFIIESLEHHGVDEIAGRWAHRKSPLAGAAHWFAIVEKR